MTTNRSNGTPHGGVTSDLARPRLLTALLVACLLFAFPAVARGLDGIQADMVLVEKGERRLSLLRDGKVFRIYRVALGKTPIGHKQHEGDGRTPEGWYVIDGRNQRSAFHRSLHISYPSAADIEAARATGTSPGDGIVIHGLPKGVAWIREVHPDSDWTTGCIAVTDQEIEELWRLVPDGTAIRILP